MIYNRYSEKLLLFLIDRSIITNMQIMQFISIIKIMHYIPTITLQSEQLSRSKFFGFT